MSLCTKRPYLEYFLIVSYGQILQKHNRNIIFRENRSLSKPYFDCEKQPWKKIKRNAKSFDTNLIEFAITKKL
jgi:hypothetical protein